MLHLPFGRSQLECDVLSFDVAQLAKPFAKRGERQLTPRSRQEPDSPEFAKFLRLDGDRYREHAPTHHGDESSPVHLLDDLVGAYEDGLRDREAQRLGGLKVDHQPELCGLLNW